MVGLVVMGGSEEVGARSQEGSGGAILVADEALEEDLEGWEDEAFEDGFEEDGFEEEGFEEEGFEEEGFEELTDPVLRPTIDSVDELYEGEDNPLNPAGDSLELLIQLQINEDLWLGMLGDLPCLRATEDCINELQALAVESNLTLQIIQERIAAIEERIEDARARNQRSVWLDTFDPLLQRYLRYEVETVNGQTQEVGFFNHLVAAFANPLNAINEALSLVGIPLIRGLTRTNARAQQNSIAIADLQVKVAEIEQGSREIAEAIRQEVMLQVLAFDQARREFQIAQEIARRTTTQHRLLEIDYRFSTRITTESYLSHRSEVDRQMAATYRAWAQLRGQLARIKITVLGSPE